MNKPKQAEPIHPPGGETLKWSDRASIQLDGLRVTLSEPALVKRSRWYCWFPSLIRQPDGTLWAIMSAYADIHISDSFCYLARSRDGGLTWDEPRVIGDAGLNHLILPDGSALVIPYYLRPRPGGAIGAPCNIISPQGELSMLPSGVNVTGWPRAIKSMGAGLATAGFVFNGQVVRGRKGEYLTTLYGHFEGDNRYSLALAESADGFAWRIRSIVAGADCVLQGGEGPCESALCRLAMARTNRATGAAPEHGRLTCVFRLDQYIHYGQTWSDDDGQTWSKPVAIPAMSVEPSLAALPEGGIALSGGRPGILAWFSADGIGAKWQSVDIMAHHNACRPREIIHPNPRISREDMILRGLSGYTSSYTALARLDERHLLLIYDRLAFGWHTIPDDSNETNSVWVVRITVGK